MKHTKNFGKVQEIPFAQQEERMLQQGHTAKLIDVNSNEGLANPSLMLWASL